MVNDELKKRIVDECKGDLPISPEIISRLTSICSSPTATAKQLAALLEMDAGLVARILRQVNSPFYGQRQPISTIAKAVVVLGFRAIRDIVLSAPLAGFYQQSRGKGGLNPQVLWDHNLETACLARILAGQIEGVDKDVLFVMTILRNVGMVAMNRVLGDEYLAIVQQAGSADDFPERERAAHGVSHVDVGTSLAYEWEFPADLISFISEHHSIVRQDKVLVYPAVVQLARRLLQGNGKGVPMEEVLAQLPAPVLPALGLSQEDCEAALEACAAVYDDAKQMLSV